MLISIEVTISKNRDKVRANAKLIQEAMSRLSFLNKDNQNACGHPNKVHTVDDDGQGPQECPDCGWWT